MGQQQWVIKTDLILLALKFQDMYMKSYNIFCNYQC
jgi:hypothetical protein